MASGLRIQLLGVDQIMRTYIVALTSLFAVCAAADDNVKEREAPATRILIKWNQPDDTGRLASVRPDSTDLQWHSEKITDGFMSSALVTRWKTHRLQHSGNTRWYQ